MGAGTGRMDGDDGTTPDALAHFRDARGWGEAAGGLVRLQVDGTGDLVELVIEERAMRLPSMDLADAVKAAFAAAREATQEVLRETVPSDGGLNLGPLTQLGTDAQRRLDEFASLAREIAGRFGRLD